MQPPHLSDLSPPPITTVRARVRALRAHVRAVRGAGEPVMIIAAQLLLPLLFERIHLPPDRRHQGAFLRKLGSHGKLDPTGGMWDLCFSILGRSIDRVLPQNSAKD